MATKTGYKQLLTRQQWYDLMESKYPHNGLIYFEQAALQSKSEKVCIECCSNKNLVECKCHIVASVPYYYMCQECHEYWESKS